MMEKKEPWDDFYPVSENTVPTIPFPAGKRELVFGILLLISAFGLCNFTIYGGFNMGFALGAIACSLCSFGYLLNAGRKVTPYSGGLLLLSVIIAAGFARSDDGFVKFVMVCFLLVSVNLALCLQAGQNLRPTGSVRSLLDAPRGLFTFGIGNLFPALRGIGDSFRNGGNAVKKGGAFLLGLCLCIPVLAILIPLLISADAAFDGLMGLLPDFEPEELITTVIFGSCLWCLLYSRGAALRHKAKDRPKEAAAKGISPITVNTVLWAVCLLYVVYLLSQLAYLFGGFAGILPEGYSTAQYARRGFFEMACLCGVNLTVTVLSLGLIKMEGSAPLMSRLLCLFICLVNLFLVAASGAKMVFYIGTYGLTRLRVLTMIIMLFMAVTTVILALWLFLPKLPYMRVVLLAALLMGAVTLWADVDTCVAQYNVNAYLSGTLETVDIEHLKGLGNGALPHIRRLAEEAPDVVVSGRAKSYLTKITKNGPQDFREWNYVNYKAPEYRWVLNEK